MMVKAVLFDLFDTLLLIRDGEAFYTPSLKKLHEFLVNNGVNVDFEDFRRVYFEVRDNLYAEASKNFEEPHFNVRVSLTLQKLGYNFEVGDTPSMDVAGPKAVGIRAILIERKRSAIDTPKSLASKPKEDPHVKPDGIIKSLKELSLILGDC
jgi:FMN phosphatase YigB (HAD superfamily)